MEKSEDDRPMSPAAPTGWLQLSFPVAGDLVDAAGELLEALGALAVSSLPGNDEPDRFDLAEPTFANWSVTHLSGLFDNDAELAPVIDALCRVLPITPEQIVVEQVEDRDWERNWLEDFKPVEITPQLWICPSWCEPPVGNAVNLVLDPGLAFGTGTHATTALCLRRLASMDLQGKTVLDFGCGSGILAIAALMLGATRALATDVDPRALDATLDNARNNGVLQRLDVRPANSMQALIGEGRIRADVVIANILADALVDLSVLLRQSMADGAQLLLSGILADQAPQVCDAYAELHFDVESRDDWILLISR